MAWGSDKRDEIVKLFMMSSMLKLRASARVPVVAPVHAPVFEPHPPTLIAETQGAWHLFNSLFTHYELYII